MNRVGTECCKETIQQIRNRVRTEGCEETLPQISEQMRAIGNLVLNNEKLCDELQNKLHPVLIDCPVTKEVKGPLVANDLSPLAAELHMLSQQLYDVNTKLKDMLSRLAL